MQKTITIQELRNKLEEAADNFYSARESLHLYAWQEYDFDELVAELTTALEEAKETYEALLSWLVEND